MLDDGWRLETSLERAVPGCGAPSSTGTRRCPGSRPPSAKCRCLVSEAPSVPPLLDAPTRGPDGWSSLLTGVALLAVACGGGGGDPATRARRPPPTGTTVPASTAATTAPTTTPKKIDTIPGMPGVPDPSNLYSETGDRQAERPRCKGALPRVYVPNLRSNTCR